MNLWIATILLYQTSTAEPPKIDPGNDPGFTAIFYLFFMLILIGSGIVGFRLRQRRTRQNKESEKKGPQSQN